jgi:hypothetical protein
MISVPFFLTFTLHLLSRSLGTYTCVTTSHISNTLININFLLTLTIHASCSPLLDLSNPLTPSRARLLSLKILSRFGIIGSHLHAYQSSTYFIHLFPSPLHSISFPSLPLFLSVFQ